MAVLALDIGTTKICALVMDEESSSVLETLSADNTFLPPVHPWERIQDPEKIFTSVLKLVSILEKKYHTFRCIGITGQMHGILYVDSSGRALSPLYTWQDTCSALCMEKDNLLSGESYAGYLARFSSGPIAPGYGLATCFYHHCTKQIPPQAVTIYTIGDYVAMRLCTSAMPVMHVTNAGGLGFFDLHNYGFDKDNMERAGLDSSLLPRVVSGGEVLGKFAGGIPVCVSIGDNQASFLGSVRDSKKSVSVNIGTGSQISLVSSCIVDSAEMEVRPFFENNFLLVGASLCGGRAYAILEKFFRQVLDMAGLSGCRLDNLSLYDVMDAMAAAGQTGEISLTVNTLFAGSRTDPSVRGGIFNISEDNFTPAQLIVGFLNGIVQELYNYYEPLKKEKSWKLVVGAGNGIRKNKPLKRIISQKFGMSLEIPLHQEEAAYGAALFALTCTGYFKTVFQAQQLVRYQEPEQF
ncbi:MAG: hypothetical protein LBH43_05845 [Treponema sp.]|jgi:sedoheptulokinase|nr:hypothetical protein [Treponema sp.]